MKVLFRRSRDTHWLLWSGFKNFENSTFIYKPDRIKNETLSVPGRCTDDVSQFPILRKVAWHFWPKIEVLPGQTEKTENVKAEKMHRWFNRS